MVKVWEHEFDHPEQSVMLALSDHSNDEGGDMWPSVDRLAWKTGYSRRNIQLIMGRLKGSGIVVVEKESTPRQPAQLRFDWTKATPKQPFDDFKTNGKGNRKGAKRRGENTAPLELMPETMPEVIPVSPQGCKDFTSGVQPGSPDPSSNRHSTITQDPESPIAPLPQPQTLAVCEPDRASHSEPEPPEPSSPVEPPRSGLTDRSSPAANSNPGRKNDSGNGFTVLGDVVGAIAPQPEPGPASRAAVATLAPATETSPGQKPDWGGKFQHSTAAFDARMRAATADPGAKAGGARFKLLQREEFRALISIGDEAWKLVSVTGDEVNFTALAIAGARTIMPEGVPLARVKAHLINKAKAGSRSELRNLIAAGEEATAKPAPTEVREALPFIAEPSHGTKKDPGVGPLKFMDDYRLELSQMYHVEPGDSATTVRARRMGIAGKLIRDLGVDLNTVRAFIVTDLLSGALLPEVAVSILVDTLKMTKEDAIAKLRNEWDANQNVHAAAALRALGVVMRG
jgi:hypothetical protein